MNIFPRYLFWFAIAGSILSVIVRLAEPKPTTEWIVIDLLRNIELWLIVIAAQLVYGDRQVSTVKSGGVSIEVRP